MHGHYVCIADALRTIQIIAGANISLEDESKVKQNLARIKDNIIECERRYGMINQLMMEIPESEDEDRNIFLMDAMK
jgi:hypothetical protein